ncbi:unnamed protein product [Ambrosiozyma monospora]|uniref:Ribonuclease H n=1 Tax=Ambrosiozyma monospora TaxID=43982 RepID=A0A9W6YPA8_AMBMO|nr:unnamed protein product [Ambrosiozyma monospora]
MSQKFYAVTKGRTTGIFTDWSSCSASVTGYSRAQFKKFHTRQAAEEYLSRNLISTKPKPKPSSQTPASGEPQMRRINSPRIAKPSRPESSLTSALPVFRIDLREALTLMQIASSPTSAAHGKPFYVPAILRFQDPRSITTEMVNPTHEPPELATVYTDGACKNNQNRFARRGGYGVFFGVNDKRNISAPLTGDNHTNQLAELTAIDKALDEIIKVALKVKFTIVTDSKYCIDCITKLANGWKQKGWLNAQGKPVANRAIIESILDKKALVNYLYTTCGWDDELEFRYVPGHSSDFGNEKADELARKGADMDSSEDSPDFPLRLPF